MNTRDMQRITFLKEEKKKPGNCPRCGRINDRYDPAMPGRHCSKCLKKKSEWKARNKIRTTEFFNYSREDSVSEILEKFKRQQQEAIDHILAELYKVRYRLDTLKRDRRKDIKNAYERGRIKERKEFIRARGEWENLRGQQLHTADCETSFDELCQISHVFQKDE